MTQKEKFELIKTKVKNIIPVHVLKPGIVESFTCQCPAHKDTHNSMCVSLTADKVLFHCFVCKDYKTIISTLQIEDDSIEPDETFLNIEELSRYVQLPENFLAEFGLKQLKFGVLIPYFIEGKIRYPKSHIRKHINKRKDERWVWTTKTADPLIPYGIWKLEQFSNDYLILVEGESDCWTFWYNNFNALGIPGAKNHNLLQKTHIEKFATTYILDEKDKGGETFVLGVTERLQELGYKGQIKVTTLPDVKDPSALWKKDKQNFKVLINKYLKESKEVTHSLLIPQVLQSQINAGNDNGVLETDTQNAEKFIEKYKNIIRFCNNRDEWYIWDGTRWHIDEKDIVSEFAIKVILDMYKTASTLTDKKERKRLVKWAMKSENKSRIDAMINLAKRINPDIKILSTELDSDPFLLNCKNGTLDLRNLILKKHDPKDLISKIIPVDYDINQSPDKWQDFICKVLNNNQDLKDFVQKAVGYTLTGLTNEQCLFFLYGEGHTGKSTFINTISSLMGDYTKNANFNSLTISRSESIRSDIARLSDARMVTAIESEDGQRFAESLIKALTGQDKVTARFLFEKEFEFVPKFKLWLGGNHRPRIRGGDQAIWRRIRMIPFKAIISESERIDNLKEILITEESSAILNWALIGYDEWNTKKLSPPSEVLQETEKYHKQQDLLIEWFENCCDTSDINAFTSNDELYESFTTYLNGEWEITKNSFGSKMTDKGFDVIVKRFGEKTKRVRKGIKLKENLDL